MSGWKALNVDSESEDEIDDTKEIQIEEAFKAYTHALRLHSQGPSYLEEARSAYDELFQSEVFKYPEALAESAIEQAEEAAPQIALPTDIEPIAILPASTADEPANLPKLVHLAFKNRGQLALDEAQHNVPEQAESINLRRYYATACRLGLADFAEALERDDADIDLWKKAARVADILSTPRIARFCLESVLAGDDDGGEQTIDISGLDEAFAAGELKDLVTSLRDDLSHLRAPKLQPKRQLLALLRKSNDPYSFLPKRSPGEHAGAPLLRLPAPPSVSLGSTSMAGLGAELLQLVNKHQDGDMTVSAQSLVTLTQPVLVHSQDEMEKDEFVDAAEELAVSSTDTDQRVDITTVEVETGEANNDNKTIDETAIASDEAVAEQLAEELEQPASNELPTRKRSSTAAGNEEPEGRIKSKRLRARESMLDPTIQDEDTIVEPAPAHQSWNWTVLKAADADMLKTVDMFLSRLDLPEFGTAEAILTESTTDVAADCPDALTFSYRRLASDLSTIMKTWTDEHSSAMLQGHGSQDFVEKSAGLTLFMQHLKVAQDSEMMEVPTEVVDDVAGFAEQMRSAKVSLYETIFLWFRSLFTSVNTGEKDLPSAYLREAWSADLKKTVVQLLIQSEAHISSILHQLLRKLAQDEVTSGADLEEASALTELVLTIFELHLDIYFRITNPSSQVPHTTRIEQMDRLERWAALTDDFMRIFAEVNGGIKPASDLFVRFLWATTVYAGKAEDVDRNQVMICLQDLKRILDKLEVKALSLPNNAAMPLLSASAAEQELFRLSTLDFFMSVFDTDDSDSVGVIEKLEPILEADSSELGKYAIAPESEVGKLIHFLNSGDASLRLYLWRRLQNVYTTISYTPKIVSCLLRAVETITTELQRVASDIPDDLERQLTELKWLKDVDDLLAKILSKVIGEADALEVLDEAHLRSSLTSISFLLRLVHVHALYEDNVRFGYTTIPQFRGSAATKLYEKSKDRLREIQIHLWSLQYILLKEATQQYPELFPDGPNDLADYLCTTHHALGQRHYCRHANKQFVKLVKTELTTLETTNNYTGDLAQVMFDLYQLRFKNTEGDFDHGCPTENMDRKTALSLIPMTMRYASQIPMKDLLKSELRNTIDRVHAASGNAKSTSPVILANRKVMASYLKSQLIPEKFYKAYKGQGGIATKAVLEDESIKAKYGWYFLLGHITLAKYRAVKRVSPTPTDDLDNAATLLRQDLEYNQERWETWWRLAQIYEAKIEDDLIWNSSKLNDARNDIAILERHSINAYLMAMTMAMRCADDSPETAQKLEDMFRELAIRLYSSSRPPLDMEAFRTDKVIRHLSDIRDQSMSKVPSRAPWTRYQLWRFAARLLLKKFVSKPKPWTSHYYRHKCLWKMFQSPENKQDKHRVTAEHVISALVDAIDALPRSNKSSEVILEPHIRMVSLMHKMVRMQALNPHQGYEALQASRFSQGVPLNEDEDGPDWEGYLLRILKKLSSADKSNWQHRIANRAAHVIYDASENVAGALGAKHEFTQQIFTKTMTYQVWKPEFERPGRHYVYTGAYVTFFAHLLDQLSDRGNLDQLVRRVRRKYQDFIDHTKIWDNLALTYVRLLRRLGKVPEGKERALFDSISYDDFTRLSEKVEQWALDPDTTSALLDAMRDAIELKRLNNSLLKGGAIDDMIGDAYACLYETYVSQLSEEERNPPQPAATPTPQDSFINLVTNPPTAPIADIAASAAAFGTHPLTLAAGQSPAPGAPPARAVPPNKPGRAKTITRREVQRKAEAAIAKPPPIKTPTLSKRPVIEINVPIGAGNGRRRGSGSGSVGGGSRRSASVGSMHGEGGRLDALRGEDGDEGSGVQSAVTSRRGSVVDESEAGEHEEGGDHDGEDGDREEGNEADDESELSDEGGGDGDEEDGEETIVVKARPAMFPGLAKRKQALTQAGTDGTVDSEADDGGDAAEEDVDDSEGEVAANQNHKT
jgi:hypothetical protein